MLVSAPRAIRVMCLIIGLASVTNRRDVGEEYLFQLLSWCAWSDRDIHRAELN